MNILIVDSDPLMVSWTSNVLQDAGHQVFQANLGIEALQRILSRDFDVMLCDVLLPDMPGEEIIRAVKAQAPQLPVVIISTAPADVWQKIGEDAGAAAFLSKPVAPEDLLREINMIAKARLNLNVAWVDTDKIHRTRLTKTLMAMGCTATSFASALDACNHIATQNPHNLWVVDGADPDIFQLLELIKKSKAPIFVFSQQSSGDLEEKLMRAGAALFLKKPIDLDTLLTQASFLAR